jgi:hypothetical protein
MRRTPMTALDFKTTAGNRAMAKHRRIDGGKRNLRLLLFLFFMYLFTLTIFSLRRSSLLDEVAGRAPKAICTFIPGTINFSFSIFDNFRGLHVRLSTLQHQHHNGSMPQPILGGDRSITLSL